MKKEKTPIDTLNQGQDIFIPHISVDCVMFGFHSGSLNVLLCKFKTNDKWMLPGGFVAKNEDPDEAAYRVLEGRTGLKNVYLRQFHFFGKKDRISADDNRETLRTLGIENLGAECYLDRFISLAYYSLIRYSEVKLKARVYEEVKWFDINEIPADLYADHNKIVETAISTIRKQVGFIPVGYSLLPEKFTMPELRGIYEAILGREIDRRNFQRKMLSIGYIKALNETRRAGAHKSPNLYTFEKNKYREAEVRGIQLMSNNL